MLNLYWRSGETTRSLIEKPFDYEQQLEQYIFEHQEILGGDVVIIHRQVRTGSREGIPDMIGVDQNGGICVIEVKNVVANESILPQALGYALWAEGNPDSLKAIWLESKNAPDDIAVDWSDLGIRVILIAPEFQPNVRRMALRIGFDIELLQVRRFGLDDDELLLVEVLDEVPQRTPGVTRVKGDWTWAYYEQEHGQEATAEFRTAVESLDAFVQRKGWQLRYNLNKSYTGFKLGHNVVFYVSWGGPHAWKVIAKLDQGAADGFRGKLWTFQSYSDSIHDAIFAPLAGMSSAQDITELEPWLEQAYRRASGAER